VVGSAPQAVSSRRAARALLVLGAIVPTVLGAAVIAVLTFWALPTGAALGERHVLLLNVVTAVIYVGIAIPVAVVWGYFWMTIPAGADEAVVGRTLLVIPLRMAVIHGAVWVTQRRAGPAIQRPDSRWLALIPG
jgi:adenylate cyclase